jgi:hypothetical protein
MKGKRRIGTESGTDPALEVQQQIPKRRKEQRGQLLDPIDPTSSEDDEHETPPSDSQGFFCSHASPVSLNTMANQQVFKDFFHSATTAYCQQRKIKSPDSESLKDDLDFVQIQQLGGDVIMFLWSLNHDGLGTGSIRTLGHAMLLWNCFIHLMHSPTALSPAPTSIDVTPDAARLQKLHDLTPVACFLLACKINTLFAPALRDVLEICYVTGISRESFTVERLHQAELEVLSAFKWDILMASSVDATEHFLLQLEKTVDCQKS